MFYSHLDRLSERRWKIALECEGENGLGRGNHEDRRADASMISAFRADLYIPESPLGA